MKRTRLSENQSHQQQVQKIAKIASWQLDMASGDLLWSDEVFSLFNIPTGTPLGYESFLQMVLPADRDYVDRKWQAALKGEPYDITHRVQVGNEVRWMREKAEITFDDSGHPISAVGIVQDVTDQKNTEHEVVEARINYRMLADYTYDWEWWVNPDRTFRYVSPACERITGYSPQRFLEDASLLREIIVQEDLEIWEKHDHESHPEIGLREIRFRIKRPDGEIRWIEHACQPIFTRENCFMGFRASNRDITRRKLMEMELHEKEKQYRDLVDNSPVAVFNTTLKGEFLFVNSAMVTIFDFETQEQMLMEKSLSLWSDLDKRKQFLSQLLSKGNVTNFEAEAVTHTGNFIHVLFSAVLNGDVISGMVMDITARKRQERIIAAQLRLSELPTEVPIDKLLQGFLDEIEKLTKSAISFYHFVEKDQKGLRLQAWSTNTIENLCSAEGKGAHYPIDKAGVWVDCVHEGRPVVYNDYMSLSHRKGLPEKHAPVTRMLLVPIFREANIVAVLGVGNKKTDYVDGDIKIVSELANMAWDTVARKQTEDALKVSEQNLQKAQEVALVGSWNLDLVNEDLTWSDESYKIFGIPRGASMNYKRFIASVHPEDREYVSLKWREALSGEPYDIEHRILVNDELKWVREKAELSFDEDGTPISGIGTTQDITRRKLAELELQESLAEIKRLKDLHEKESLYLRDEINLEHDYKNIIGNSNAIQYVLFKVEQVAEADSTVIVLGETGTGKELIARAIHNSSKRSKRPLIKINCAALPANLIESELFGHERGSFTGAMNKYTGRFEVADGSSIFLDEIGELPLELQAKLLRVIEDGEFERLGSTRTLKVDVRIIAATNRDLEKDVREGKFRKDLWYRLNVFPITLPPLRDRGEDIPLIVQYYVDIFARKLGKNIESVPSKVMKTLKKYTWPGNIRELTNVLERAVISTAGSQLSLAEELKGEDVSTLDNFATFREIQREYIIKVLEKTDWKVSGKDSAADILGLDRSTLRAKMKKLDICKP